MLSSTSYSLPFPFLTPPYLLDIRPSRLILVRVFVSGNERDKKSREGPPRECGARRSRISPTRVMLYALREEITCKRNIFQIKISTRFSSSTSRRTPRVKGINVKRRDGNLISFCPNFILSPFPLPLFLSSSSSPPFRTMAMYFNSLLRKEFQPARARARARLLGETLLFHLVYSAFTVSYVRSNS